MDIAVSAAQNKAVKTAPNTRTTTQKEATYDNHDLAVHGTNTLEKHKSQVTVVAVLATESKAMQAHIRQSKKETRTLEDLNAARAARRKARQKETATTSGSSSRTTTVSNSHSKHVYGLHPSNHSEEKTYDIANKPDIEGFDDIIERVQVLLNKNPNPSKQNILNCLKGTVSGKTIKPTSRTAFASLLDNQTIEIKDGAISYKTEK